MLRQFQRDQSWVSLFIFIFIVSTVFLIPPANENVNTFPLFGRHIEVHWQTWFSNIAATLLILTIAVLLVRLNVVFNFIRVRTYLPAMFYVLLVFPFTKGNQLEPVLLTVPGLITILFILFRSFKQKGMGYHYFHAGLFLGVISVLYAPYIFYIVFVYICFLLLRPFNWREMIYPVMGTLVIFYLIWGVFYLADLPGSYITRYFQSMFEEHVQFIPTTSGIVFLSLTGLLTVISSFHVGSRLLGKKIYSRRIFTIFWWLLVISLIIYFSVPLVSVEIVYILAIPCSFLLSHYYANVRPVIMNQLLFIIFIITSIVAVYV